jgi:putative ABC transport system permease protein
MDSLRQDILYALRRLGRSRHFTLVAILTLAIGIGGTTTMFSVIHTVLLKPLPFERPERLVAISQVWEGEPTTMSPANFHDARGQSRALQSAAAYDESDLTLTGQGEPVRLKGTTVSASFFEVLGVRPLLGRTFRADENSPGKEEVIVIDHALWQQRFGGRREIIDQPITIDGEAYVVVGIMPPGFSFPFGREAWVPYAREGMFGDGNRGAWFVRAVGRLRDGATLESARTELATIGRRLEQQYPDSNAKVGLTARPLHEAIVGNVRTALLVLMGAVSFVLLITCTNLANLLLARAAGRASEMAVRSALGAARHRLVRQLLTESIVLALAGGIAGVLLAMWALDSLVALNPGGIQRLDTVRIDRVVMAFTAGVSMLTALLFGILPAFQTTGASLASTLKEGGRSMAHAGRRTRGALVVAEVALAVTLLAGAGLLIRSFARLQSVDPGFRPEQTLTFALDLPESRYKEDSQRTRFYETLVERLEALPGARRAGAVILLPLRGNSFNLSFTVAGWPPPTQGEEPTLETRVATPGYFQTLGIPLLKGRLFTAQDDERAPQVALISERAARKFFPGEDPIGRKIRLGWGRGKDKPNVGGEVIGIVGDVAQVGLDIAADPEIYVPHAQVANSSMEIVVRADVPPEMLAAAVRREVRLLDADLPIERIETLEEIVAESISRPRFYMLLVAIFAGVALLLAAVGIFGVMSCSVAQRTRELGIRIALGAGAGALRRLVVGQAMTLATIGLAIGLAAALLLSSTLEKMLFNLSSTDPATFVSVAGVLFAVALLASWLPARRASKVDPVVALRAE